MGNEVCGVLVPSNDAYENYEHYCSFKATATATSKILKNGIDGAAVIMRLCTKHTNIYEKRSKSYWSIKRD